MEIPNVFPLFLIIHLIDQYAEERVVLENCFLH